MCCVSKKEVGLCVILQSEFQRKVELGRDVWGSPLQTAAHSRASPRARSGC